MTLYLKISKFFTKLTRFILSDGFLITPNIFRRVKFIWKFDKKLFFSCFCWCIWFFFFSCLANRIFYDQNFGQNIDAIIRKSIFNGIFTKMFKNNTKITSSFPKMLEFLEKRFVVVFCDFLRFVPYILSSCGFFCTFPNTFLGKIRWLREDRVMCS